MFTWNRRDSTPLSVAPIKVGCFGLINPVICSPYLVFHSRVRTEFVIVFIGNPFEMKLLNLRVTWSKTWCDRQQLWKDRVTGDRVIRLSIPIRGRG